MVVKPRFPDVSVPMDGANAGLDLTSSKMMQNLPASALLNRMARLITLGALNDANNRHQSSLALCQRCAYSIRYCVALECRQPEAPVLNIDEIAFQ